MRNTIQLVCSLITIVFLLSENVIAYIGVENKNPSASTTNVAPEPSAPRFEAPVTNESPSANDLKKPYRVDPKVPSRRYALLVGNWDYDKILKLEGSESDIRNMSTTLSDLGFLVYVAINSDKRTLDATIKSFIASMDNPSAILFYFAGHGVEINNQLLMLPTDFDTRDFSASTFAKKTLGLNDLLGLLKHYNAIPKLVFIDTCRDNPLRSLAAADQTIQRETPNVKNTFIGYATAADGTASEGLREKGGVFTNALRRAIKENRGSIYEVFSEVVKKVEAYPEAYQTPWQSSSLTEPFYFHRANVVKVSETSEPNPKGVSLGTGTVRGVETNQDQSAPWKLIAIFVFGVVFASIILTLAFVFPTPTDFQYTVSRIILALSTSSVATLLTGFLEVQIPDAIKAGGALAVFVIVYFYSPARLLAKPARED